jgi:hypothetical protein
MVTHVHFASVAGWLIDGIAGLLWMIASAITAIKMEKEGFTFWRGFLTCLLLTPLAGALAILVARMLRPTRPLIETASRG